MSTHWIVERTPDERFPWRISIEQDGRVTLALRAQERWPGPGGQVFCLRERAVDPGEKLEPVERVPVASLSRLGRKLAVVLDRAQNRRCNFLFLTRPYKDRPGSYEQIFFRTQSGMRAHRSQGRLQLFGKAPIEIVIDSRERYPWRFRGASVRRDRLPAGDYALVHHEHTVAVVERKSFENLLHDVGQVQLLHQQLAELATYPHAAVVVEAQYGDFLRPERVGRWPVTHVARVIAEIAALHPRVPLVFAGNRKLAAEWTHGFLSAVAARLDDGAPDQVAEPATLYAAVSTGGADRAVRHAVLYEFPARFTAALLRRRFPEVPAVRLRRLVGKLRDEGRLTAEGRGRATCWIRVDPPVG